MSVATTVEATSPHPRAATVTEHCPEPVDPHAVQFGFREWMRQLEICFEGPATPTGPAERCQPVGCPDCDFHLSRDALAAALPDELTGMYVDIRTLLGLRGPRVRPGPVVERLRARLGDLRSGRYFDAERQKAAAEAIAPGGTLTPRQLGELARALNALELDRAVPSLGPLRVTPGGPRVADFEGVARLVFSGLAKGGSVRLELLEGLPALPSGYLPTWPVLTYRFEFDGALAEAGSMLVSFYYGGVSVFETPDALQILEWDGRVFRALPTRVDRLAAVVSARARGSSTFVIATASANRSEKAEQ